MTIPPACSRLPEGCAACLTEATAFLLPTAQRGAALITRKKLPICPCFSPLFLYYGYNTITLSAFPSYKFFSINVLLGVFIASQHGHILSKAMRYSKGNKAETDARIVQKASERFRAEGWAPLEWGA
jgi:hypothetical protein